VEKKVRRGKEEINEKIDMDAIVSGKNFTFSSPRVASTAGRRISG
jgi:hypothetical protein